MIANECRVTRQDVELRTTADGGLVLEGYGAVFNRFSANLGGFVEVVDPVAFNDTLSRDQDVAGLGNHDPSWLLATSASGTLTLEADTVGLRYAMTLDPNDPDALRMVAKVKTKKMRGSSFSFTTMPDGDEWTLTDQGMPLRRLLKVRLYDVGPVTFPAYPDTANADTAVAMRSLATLLGRPLDEVCAAARSAELRSLIAAARDGAPPEPAPAQPRFVRSRFRGTAA